VPPNTNPSMAKVKPSRNTPARAVRTTNRKEITGSNNEMSHEASGNQSGLISIQKNATAAMTNQAAKLGVSDSQVSASRVSEPRSRVMIGLLTGDWQKY
jgi:hypothetical protein